jgi:RHS repeat-associated protein
MAISNLVTAVVSKRDHIAVRDTRQATAVGEATHLAFRRQHWTELNHTSRYVVVGAGLTAILWLLGAGSAAADVSPTGSFSNEVAVQVPAFHGIEPSISLTYDSTTPDGLLGVGWRLNAASYITRAGAHGGAPRFDSTDVFMLDGAQLVRCAPGCGTGGTHETRQRDFTRITFDGTRWTRWRPNGVQLRYDPLPLANSKGTYRWALSTVTDTHGNTVTYDHDCDGSECYPASITYADGPEHCEVFGDLRWCTPGPEGARVRFHYEARPDPVSYGTGTGTVVTAKRLKTIEVRMAGALVRAYALGYKTSKSTGSSLLRSVQLFPSDATIDTSGTVSAGATKPQSPTVFATTSMASPPAQWSSKPLLTGGLSSLGAAGPGNSSDAHVFRDITISNRAGQRFDPATGEVVRLSHGSLLGDFDGDGRTDMAFWSMTSCSGTVHITTVLADRPTSPVETGPEPNPLSAPPCANRMSAFAADLNGDGIDDAVFMSRLGALRQVLAMGGGMFAIGTTTTPSGFDPPNAAGPNRPQCRTGDVDGDRRTDLVCLFAANGTGYLGTARAQVGGGFAVTKTPLPVDLPTVAKLQLALGDVDADRRANVILAAQAGATWHLAAGAVTDTGTVILSPAQDTVWSTGLNTHTWDLASADIDGDGRADVALTRAEYQGPTRQAKDAVFVATSPKAKDATTTFAPRSQPIDLGATYTLLADADGDGRADLMTGTPVGEALAVGDGRFASWAASAPGSVACGRQSSIFVPGEGIIPDHWLAGEPGQPYSAVDVNGDGRADRLCVADVDVDDFTATDVVSPNRPADLHRWMPADVTGTGRQDLVYVHFRNPGIEVYTLTRDRSSGEFTRTSTAITPRTTMPPPMPIPSQDMPLTNANAGAWMPIDVGGGPNGVPDGKTDLVLVDRDPDGTLRVYTLLSTGSGWIPKVDTPWRVNQKDVFGSSPDVQRWRPANLNGDGRSDMVHLVPLGQGVRMEYLLARGDGTWDRGSGPHDYFTSATADAPALTALNVQDFLSTDVDGDQLTDFAFVEGGSGDTIIRTLVGNGDASFSARSFRDPVALTAAQERAFQPMDFNGDGMTDLGLVRLGGVGCLSVAAFVSTGTSWTVDETAPVAGCKPAVGVQDTNNIRLVDVDHDNRTDILHLSRYLDGDTPMTAVHLLLNRPVLRWPVVDPPALALAHPDTWAYASMDTDDDGRAELVHVGDAKLDTVHIEAGSDLVTAINNGRGATTSISYRSLVGARTYLPSGSLPTVVDKVAVSDAAHDPPATETTSWTYDGARWSDQDRQLLGFASITSTQGRAVRVTGYELTDPCGARPATTSVENTGGKVFTSSESHFKAPGSGPPFTCLTGQLIERDREGEPEGNWSTKTTTFEYDSIGQSEARYGNVTTKVETGTRAGNRKTTTDFKPNTGAYVVDRPARQEIQEFDPNAPAEEEWRSKAITEYLYDANNAWDSPPGTKGELRRTRAWNDRDDSFAETWLDYDGHGNLTKTTSPVGVIEETHFDPDRSLFPIRICNPPVGCREQTWKLKYGAPETVTDVNQQVTSHDYDTYGRQTLVTNPDGSSSSTFYLNEGNYQGADSQRQRIRTEVSDGSKHDGVLWQEQLVDGLGRVYKTIREGDDSGPIISETRFADASDRPEVTVDAHVGCCGAWTEYRYDDAHRLEMIILPDGATTKIEYQAGATLTTDPVDRQQRSVRDEFGRTIRVEQRDRHPCTGCPPKTWTAKYGYDALDRPTRIIDAQGNLTETIWDSLGRKISERDPDLGERSWTWRPDGTPDTTTDAKGQVTRWFYDSAGRQIRRTEHAANGQATAVRTSNWRWDRDPSNGQTHGSSLGRVVRVDYRSPIVSGATDTWYDRMGQVERSRQCANNNCAELGFAFDKAGRLATISYPDAQRALSNKSEQVTHTYDTAGRLATVTGHDPTLAKPNTSYATELGYDPLGQLERLKHSNAVIDSFTYDDTDTARHWLDSIDVTNFATDTTLYSATYSHYPDGKLQSQTEHPGSLQQQFHYDDFERLTTVTASDPGRSRAYSYDSIGRMTSSTTAGAYTYGDSAHLHAPTSTNKGHTRSYDANGNLKTLRDPNGRDLTIDWTTSDMPERIVAHPSGAATVIGYDANNQRVVKRDDHGTTYYMDRYLEQDSNGRLIKYYWAEDRLVARRDSAGKLIDFHQDRLGSTRLLTNAKGSVAERYDYDLFGKPLTPPARDERLWKGQRSDSDSGLIYMNARYYDPELGRFASADTIIPDPYRPQSIDRYAYAENDWANYTDPSGHMKMQVELRKEQAAQSPFGAMYARALNAGCGVFQEVCVRYAPGLLVEENYTSIGKARVLRQKYGGGLGPDGTWLADQGSTQTLYGSPKPSDPPLVSVPDMPQSPEGMDPSELAQWPQGIDPSELAQWPTAPPLISAPKTPVRSKKSNPSEWAQWPGTPSAPSAPPLISLWTPGTTTLTFIMGHGLLYVDPGVVPGPTYTMPATSGRGTAMNDPSSSHLRNIGPLPPGEYEAEMTKLTNPGVLGDFLRQLTGDWGDWRVPLIPMPSTTTYGRNEFFIHGGSLAGSKGCIDIGGGTRGDAASNRLLRDLQAPGAARIPVTVF